MFVRVFEYTAAPGRAEEFEAAYGPRGGWVQLFALAEGYLGSTLEHRGGDRYRTQDHWRSAEDFNTFLVAHRAAYDALDRDYASLKLTEEHCGHFTQPQPAGEDWRTVQ